MKKIFISIPALLALSGCVTSLQGELEYRKQCSNLEKSYFDSQLFDKTLKEKNIIIVNKDNSCTNDTVCSKLIHKDRWDNIKIVDNNISNPNQIIYYREYNLENCSQEQDNPHIYSSSKGDFCIGQKRHDNIEYRVKFISDSFYLFNKNNVKVKKKYDRLYYYENLVLSRDAIIYQAPTAHETCNSDDKIYDKLRRNI